jgi:hypothetical protein
MTATQRDAPGQQPSQSPASITEEQAKTMWCPYAMSSIVRNVGGMNGLAVHNRDHASGDPAPGCQCLASACMCWIADAAVAGMGYCGMAVP